MKLTFLSIFTLLIATFSPAFGQEEKAKADSFLLLEPIEVMATRAGALSPFTRTDIYKKEIGRLNLGQDLPFLLNHQPSVVIYSDAGNGVGYTGLRIRGTDASRINVTINGIPFNDAESQGSFFVDLPDILSSVGSIQVQRGVGTSSNGPGAFGATINISTNEANPKPYAEFNNSFGSFKTWKNTIRTGSGLLGDRFTTDVRFSRITSEGYIDRASSDLQAYYFSTAYINNATTIRFNHFSGREKTYQAWYGIKETDLQNNRTVNYAGTEKPGEPYDDEKDNYEQDHFQLFFNHEISPRFKFNTALFYVKGRGYYEQYKSQQPYADYQLTPPSMGNIVETHTDLIRQLWLDNDFYGNVFSFLHKSRGVQLTLGGGWNAYEGDHFGEVTWAEKGISHPARWYNNDAYKKDLNIYFKQQTQLGKKFSLFYDLQVRHVKYSIDGFRNNPALQVMTKYHFFNPKAGVNFTSKEWRLYASFARGQKEPNRDDFETGTTELPKVEKLDNIELGFEHKTQKNHLAAVLYYMNYKDQLILTGLINDVGAYTRTNIPESYRMGIELTVSNTFTSWLSTSMNLSLSRNKIRSLVEYLDDYDNGGQKINIHTSTDIAFSPSIISNASIELIPLKNVEIVLSGKYTGKQFLDNTQNEQRKLQSFITQDTRAVYTFKKGKSKEVAVILQVNNMFNTHYEPNGYTFSYYYGGEIITENYYYPMAGRNFMFGVNVKF